MHVSEEEGVLVSASGDEVVNFEVKIGIDHAVVSIVKLLWNSYSSLRSFEVIAWSSVLHNEFE